MRHVQGRLARDASELEFADGKLLCVTRDLEIGPVSEIDAIGDGNRAGENITIRIDRADVRVDRVNREQRAEQRLRLRRPVGTHLAELRQGGEQLPGGFDVLLLRGGGEAHDSLRRSGRLLHRRAPLINRCVEDQSERWKNREQHQRQQPHAELGEKRLPGGMVCPVAVSCFLSRSFLAHVFHRRSLIRFAHRCRHSVGSFTMVSQKSSIVFTIRMN